MQTKGLLGWQSTGERALYSYDFRSLCNEILEIGLGELSMGMGIVSQIENNKYEIIAVKSSVEVFVPGEIFPLKDTYCRVVVDRAETVALTEFDGHPGLQRHPLYENLALEAYISTPIFRGDSIWGTLNFSSMQLSPSPFTDMDIEFVEMSAERISAALALEY